MAPVLPFPALAKFEVGKTYSCRSACDYNCVWTFTVVSRTDKRLTLQGDGRTVTKAVKIFNGTETVFPLGSYSMAPILRAG